MKNSIESLNLEIKGLKEEVKRLNKVINQQNADTQANLEHQETQIKFRTVFETSRLGKKILNSDLEILYVNEAMVSLLGYDSKEDIIGSSILEYATDDKKEDWKVLQEKLWTKATPSFSLETCLTKKDGTQVWCQVTSILFEDMNTTLGYTIIEDITTQYNLRKQKEQFINLASHELQTPLTSLKAGLQLMSRIVHRDSEITDQLRKLCTSVEVNAQKMTVLIADLLASTKIEQGHLKLVKTRFKFAELLDKCCTHIRLAGNYHILNRIDENLEVFADENKIDQVLVNLVNNAVKYAPDSKEIIFEMEHLPGFIKISVTDRGKGIPKEKLSHLFDQYYQVNNNDNHNSGMGLGLYISLAIIKRHNGEMGVKSEIDKGSTFWFTLPN
jgi:PAS domain S-box-containing protein